MTFIDSVQPPRTYDVFKTFKSDINASLRVCLPITVTKVNSNGTVNVQPALSQMTPQVGNPLGLASPYPELQNCPLYTSQGSGAGSVFPPKIGDTGYIIFADRCLDSWKINGVAAPLPDYRMHDLSDGIVIIGLNPLISPLNTPLDVGEGGICETNNGFGVKVAINPVTHKATIQNGTENLFTAITALTTTLTALISALSTLGTTGSATAQVVNPATIAALATVQGQLTAVQAQFAELLY